MTDAARGNWARALWAGLLSLVLPGLGQIYAGWWRFGVVLFIGGLALGAAFLGLTWRVPPTPVIVATAGGVMLAFHLFAAGDAIRRVRSAGIVTPRPWYRSTWLAAIVMIAVGAGVELAKPPPGWRSFHVASASNVPTLSPNDYIVAGVRLPATLPNYGDVIIFRHPQNPAREYIRRVVGLPGDLVQLRDGALLLNGKSALREADGHETASPTARQIRETLPNGRSYLIQEKSGDAPANTGEYVVPDGALFVVGDNRSDSVDSRSQKELGYVPVADVIGIVETVFWSSDLARLLSRVR